VFFMSSLLALQKDRHDAKLAHQLHGAARPGYEIGDIRICQGDGIARSRNNLAAQFMRSDCTHLLFIDCDLIFHADHVGRIVEHDEPVVGGLYPKKQEGVIEWVLNTLRPQPKPDERGLQPMLYVGTGFLCLRRDVLERMRGTYPESHYREDYGERLNDGFDFFPMGVYRGPAYPDGRYLSEDWYFSQRCQDMGIPVLADTKVILKHIGPAIYPLSYQEQELFARAGVKPDGTPLDDQPSSRAAPHVDTGAPAACALTPALHLQPD
jgi:hypothetical protein